MDSRELSDLTADPIQTLGMSFYFDPATVARAKELGLKWIQFYGLGRGGVLGNVDSDVVHDAFTFFHQSTIDFLWDRAREKADPVEMVEEFTRFAYVFADHTFGSVPVEVLARFAEACKKVTRAVTPGRHLLFDGYARLAVPENPVHAAYLGTILLRELRGGVHIDAVGEVDLSPTDACYLQDANLFKLHGYGDDDAPTVTLDLEAKKLAAEELTTGYMANYFAVLDDTQRQYVADGTTAMFAALMAPVAVPG
jgi:hypothetical protein